MTSSKHGCSFEIIERGPKNEWQTWLATCECGERWTGPSYEVAEDKWREHHLAATTVAPKPMGSQVGRWSA